FRGGGLIQGGQSAFHGAAGAGDLVLVGDDGGRVEGGRVCGDLVAFVAHHHGDALRVQAGGGVHHVAQQATSANGMENLRGRGLHPRPLAGGKNDHSCGGRQAHRSTVAAAAGSTGRFTVPAGRG